MIQASPSTYWTVMCDDCAAQKWDHTHLGRGRFVVFRNRQQILCNHVSEPEARVALEEAMK